MLTHLKKTLSKKLHLISEKQPSFVLGQLLRVSYRDQYGNITDRKVMVVSYEYMESLLGKEYVHVFCYLKRESRIFYVSRILEYELIKLNDLKE